MAHCCTDHKKGKKLKGQPEIEQVSKKRSQNSLSLQIVGKVLSPAAQSSGNPWISKGRLHEPLLGKTIIIKDSKSIRTKYLLKKYVNLWIRKVYGRVSPVVARHYYNTHILQQAVIQWKEEWWMKWKEWKLNIRADCHNKYRLWGLAWRGWNKFMNHKREKRKILLLCAHIESSQLRKHYFSLWVKYVTKQQQLLHDRHVSNEYHYCVLKRRAMKLWVEQYKIVSIQREKYDQAICHYKRWLLIKYQRVWMYCTKLSNAATTHYHQTLLRQTIEGWKRYINTNNGKRSDKDKGILLYRNHLLKDHFNMWRKSIQQLDKGRHFEDHRKLSTLKGILTAWKSYMRRERLHNKQSMIATNHYKSNMKRIVLKGLLLYTQQQRTSKDFTHIALAYNQQRCLRVAWRAWLHRCEHSEDRKLYPLTKQARLYYSHSVFSYYWKRWRGYVKSQKLQATQQKLATLHYRRNTLPIYFDALRKNVELHCHKRELKLRSNEFKRKILLSQFFYYWWQCSVQQYTDRETHSQAVLYHKDQLLKWSLNVWRYRTHVVHVIIEMECSANSHYKEKLLSRSIKKWRENTNHTIYQCRLSECHYNEHLVRSSWLQWRCYIVIQKEDVSNDCISFNYWSMSLYYKYFIAWKSYYRKKKVMTMKYSLARRHYHYILARYTVSKWIDNVRFIIQRREQLTNALVYQHKSLVMRAFEMWKRKVDLKRQLLDFENNQVAMVTKTLNGVKVMTAFISWFKLTQKKLYQRELYLKAYQFNIRRLQKHHLNNWLTYHKIQVKQKDMREKGERFNETRLVFVYYSQWRLMFMEQLVRQHQTILSLWHWSKELQEKVLMNWLDHTERKKRQKRRYLVAMETYRHQLLVRGVAQWIEVASTIKGNRNDMALKQHMIANSNLWQCVRRCASHWRTLTIRNKGTTICCHSNKPRATPMISHVKRVTPSINKATPTSTTYWDNLMSEFKVPSDYKRASPRCPLYLSYTDVAPPLPPTILQASDTSMSVSANSSVHSNKPHLLTSNSTLLKPSSWQLLPPSAFVNGQILNKQ